MDIFTIVFDDFFYKILGIIIGCDNDRKSHEFFNDLIQLLAVK